MISAGKRKRKNCKVSTCDRNVGEREGVGNEKGGNKI
jgi:hypothetical protein